MKAAVITAFGQPPSYREIDEPGPAKSGQMRVEVLASGLHHVTRGRASGTHYSSAGEVPLIAGIDGVGRGCDGKLRYFVQEPGRPGTMAERTVIDLDHSIVLPRGSDPVVIAGAMNPAMASWLALRCRVPSFRRRLPFQKGKQVLILGATGSSGSMAVQVARHLGATRVIAAGRDIEKLSKLPALGATETVPLLDAGLGELACEVDVVLDFVWGDTSAQILEAVLKLRADRSRPLDWIHVGSMDGDTAPIPGFLLRAAKVQILGSGHGAVPGRAILKALPGLIKEISRGTFRINVRRTPLSDVEQAWADDNANGGRIVFTP